MIIKGAYIEITNRCNLNCSICYNRSGLTSVNKELSFLNIKKITNRLNSEFKCNTIIISGGEPTKHSEFDQILDFLVNEQKIETYLITNGTIMNDYLINLFQTKSNLHIQVSLDGSSEKINKLTRGNGNFYRSVNFIKQLTRNNLNKKPEVKMVVSKNNILDIEDFFQFIIDTGGIPKFDFINCIGNASDKWDSLSISSREKLNVLKRINKLNSVYDIKTSLPYCTYSCPLDSTNFEHSVLIKNDGSIHPCQLLYDEKYKLGNLLNDSFDKIEKSLIKITEIARARKKLDFKCTKCPAQDFCQKGCMAMAEIYTRNPLGSDNECEYRKLQLLGFR